MLVSVFLNDIRSAVWPKGELCVVIGMKYMLFQFSPVKNFHDVSLFRIWGPPVRCGTGRDIKPAYIFLKKTTAPLLSSNGAKSCSSAGSPLVALSHHTPPHSLPHCLPRVPPFSHSSLSAANLSQLQILGQMRGRNAEQKSLFPHILDFQQATR